MASYEKRGDKWRAFVCIDRKRASKTFALKRDAIAWANAQEQDGILARHTLHEALERYKPIAENLRGWQPAISRIKSLQASSIALLPLESITPAVIAKWRDKRLEEVAGVSVRSEMILLSSVWKLAIREWGWAVKNPLDGLKKPLASPARRRGISQAEIDEIRLKLAKSRLGGQVWQAFELALETGMRMGEIVSLRWADVRDKFVILPKTKNGDIRHVPLSTRAREIIKERTGLDDETVFTLSAHTISQTFRRNAIEGVHFHDSRSEAITRLSKRLDVLQLARMIGHRDIKSLLLYYSESADSLADRL